MPATGERPAARNTAAAGAAARRSPRRCRPSQDAQEHHRGREEAGRDPLHEVVLQDGDQSDARRGRCRASRRAPRPAGEARKFFTRVESSQNRPSPVSRLRDARPCPGASPPRPRRRRSPGPPATGRCHRPARGGVSTTSQPAPTATALSAITSRVPTRNRVAGSGSLLPSHRSGHSFAGSRRSVGLGRHDEHSTRPRFRDPGWS